MSKWEGIEDASAKATTVWLSRATGEVSADESEGEKPEQQQQQQQSFKVGPWMPLRKTDCAKLNHSGDKETVHIEGGRFAADKQNCMMRCNFYKAPSSELIGATWFELDERIRDKDQKILPQPLSIENCNIVEKLYQQIVLLKSKSKPITDSVLTETQAALKEENGEDSTYKVALAQRGDSLRFVKRPSGFSLFGAGEKVLQRGYGPYIVEGEDEEISLGPVGHLIFIVHGIGEAMFSRKEVTLPSLIDEVNRLRTAIHKLQYQQWRAACDAAEKEKKVPLPPPPMRIEVLPIEWYNQIHSSSKALMKSLNAITIPSIPTLRAIANDVIFDVLMYMTPAFSKEVLECVTTQINDLFQSFQKVHKDFSKDGGKCSIMGHSLGSVIAWDLLALLKLKQMKTSEKVASDSLSDWSSKLSMCGTNNVANEDLHTWGPVLPSPIDDVIPFVPEFTAFLGSPIGLFLTLRGAHDAFDKLRVDPEQPVSPFSLPSKSIYNIFNQSDPIAYRIEPLLFPNDYSDIPDPVMLDPTGDGLRLHVRAQQLGNTFGKTLTHMISKISNGSGVSGNEGQIGTKNSSTSLSSIVKFDLAGSGNSRVDYALQKALVDNEYISAVSAHSTYWVNSDVIKFVVSKASTTRDWKGIEVCDLTSTTS